MTLAKEELLGERNSPVIMGGKCKAFYISEISEAAKQQANPEN